MAKLYLVFFLAILSNALVTHAQGPSIGWQKCLGGSGNDSACSIASGPAGGVIVAGSSASNDGDVTGHHGAVGVIDAWVVSLRYDGQLLWEKSYGGSGADKFNRIIPTADGGYIAIGSTTSADGDVTGLHGAASGNTDIWVVKLDASGNLQWQKCLGGSGQDVPANILQTADGGFILVGTTTSTDGDVTGNHGGEDVWVVRLDSGGNLVWQQCYGNSFNDVGNDIQPIGTGKYVLSVSADGNGGGSYGGLRGGNSPNAFMFLIDSLGNVVNVTVSGAYSGFYSALPVNNDLFYISRITWGDICLMNPVNRINILQFDSTLQSPPNEGPITALSYCYPTDYNVSWGYSLSGSGAMGLLNNGTGIVAGITDDTASHLNPHGNADGFLANFGPNSWVKCYGGPGSDYFSGIVLKDQFTYVTAGYSNSNSGDVSGNHGGYDFWVVQVGNYNVIKGTAFLDYNKNGVQDNGEPPLNNILVQSVKGGNSSGSLTSNGIFDIAVDSGTYTTSVVTTVPNYTVMPANHVSVFSGFNNADSTNFAFQPIPGRRDYELSIYNQHSFNRPKDTTIYIITYSNPGTDTLQNKVVEFIADPRTLVLSSSVTPLSVSGDTVRWNVTSLAPRETGTISVVAKLAAPPTLNYFDTLIVSGSIDTTGDLNPQNNSFTLKETVLYSFDPNGKTEANAGRITAQDVAEGKYLEYKVYFQNTGTDTAFTVTVRDSLASNLDMSTFQMVGASASYSLATKGDILTWTFSGIRLPDSTQNAPGSEGYLVYRIKPSPSVAVGDSIENGAAIYFDYNLPVITNVETTYVVSNPTKPPPTGDSTVVPGGLIIATPNPFAGELTVRGLDPAKSYGISLVDAGGRQVLSEEVQGQSQSTLTTGSLGFGIYFLKISDAPSGRVVAVKVLLRASW